MGEIGKDLQILLNKERSTLPLTERVIGFNAKHAKELLDKNPRSLFVGLSLSRVLPSLITGDLPQESVPFLLTGTAHETFEKALADIMRDPRLNGRQEEAEKILKAYWENGRIIQLRRLIQDLPRQLAASNAPLIKIEDLDAYIEQRYGVINPKEKYSNIIRYAATKALYNALCTSPTTPSPQPPPLEVQQTTNIIDPGVSK